MKQTKKSKERNKRLPSSKVVENALKAREIAIRVAEAKREHYQEFREALGGAIADRRIALGIYQHDLAAEMRVATPNLSRIENGRKDLSVIELILCCKALGLEYSELVTDATKRLLDKDLYDDDNGEQE